MSSDLPTPIEYGALTRPQGGLPTLGGAPLPTAFDGFGEENEPGFDWHRYLSAILRYKYLVIAITVIGTGIGAVASRFFSPKYRTEAKVWIAASSAGSISGAAVAGQETLVDTYAWTPLLRSREVLRYVVLQHRLYLSVTNPADSLRIRLTKVVPHLAEIGPFRRCRTNRRYAYVSAGRHLKLSPRDEGIVGDLRHLMAIAK